MSERIRANLDDVPDHLLPAQRRTALFYRSGMILLLLGGFAAGNGLLALGLYSSAYGHTGSIAMLDQYRELLFAGIGLVAVGAGMYLAEEHAN